MKPFIIAYDYWLYGKTMVFWLWFPKWLYSVPKYSFNKYDDYLLLKKNGKELLCQQIEGYQYVVSLGIIFVKRFSDKLFEFYIMYDENGV